MLDIEPDADHNRSVLTFVGTPDAVREAAMAVSGKAIELIDLNQHRGQHPRMGAVDVVPFVPTSEITMVECVQLAKAFAAEHASKYSVPVFLYEEAATRPERKNLADVREGEFEGLREQIEKNPEKIPDFGPNVIHPTAGATAVGARSILIAYNVDLATGNLDTAKKIAKQVRGKDGGLSAVKALAFALKDRGIVQVSMNMVDYKASQLFKAFELVKALAQHHDVQILASEIVGLVPMEALVNTAEFYLQLERFSKNQILETKLLETQTDRLVALDLEAFGSEVASEKPVPGGGSVSAYVGSLAASLVSMVSRLTLKKPEYQQHWPKVEKIVSESDALQQRLFALVDEDSRSSANLMQAYHLPKSSDQEKRARSAEIQNKVRGAAEVPLTTAENAARTMSLANSLSNCANENALSDLQTAIFLAHASAMGALSNVTTNLAGIKDDEYRAKTGSKIDAIQKQIEQDKTETIAAIASRARQ